MSFVILGEENLFCSVKNIFKKNQPDMLEKEAKCDSTDRDI